MKTQIPIPRDATDRASGDIEKSSDEKSEEENEPEAPETGDQPVVTKDPALPEGKVQTKSGQKISKSY